MAEQDLIHIVRQLAVAADRERTDRELLERFAASRDETAFAALVHRHGPLVLGVCRRVLQDGQEAEDAFQAVFLVLARRAAAVRWRDSVRNWLYEVAGRVARQARARRLRRQQHETAAARLPRPECSGSTWQELCGVLDEELGRLPARYRAVLVSCYLEGKTRDEAGEQLGASLSSIKKRLERGRDLLRRRLARRGLSFSAALLAGLLAENAAPAAVPALLQVASVRTATSTMYPIPGSVAELASGVMRTMTMHKIKIVALALLAVLGLGTGFGAWFFRSSKGEALAAPIDLVGAPARIEPGQVAVGKPDRNGVVSMLRPMVTHLTPDDPMRVILHWAAEKGPLRRGQGPAEAVHRPATLRSMTFTITAPDGRRHTLRPAVSAKDLEVPGLSDFAYEPTFLLTLGTGGFKATQSRSVGWEGPWADQQKVGLDKPGVYVVQIAGSLVFRQKDKETQVPFEAGPIAIEVGLAGIKPLSQVEAAARAALERQTPGIKLMKNEPAIIHESKTGTRLVRLVSESTGRWSYQESTVEVKPDGGVGAILQREVGTCVARGTLIESERGLTPIEDAREGDRVWGFDVTAGRRVLTTIRLVRRGQAEETLVFADALRVTARHPLLVNNGWEKASDVGPEDFLLGADLRRVRAGVPRHVRAAIDVYDLTVDEPHTFFAGGFLVHNKDRDYWPHVDDLWYVLWPPAKS